MLLDLLWMFWAWWAGLGGYRTCIVTGRAEVMGLVGDLAVLT